MLLNGRLIWPVCFSLKRFPAFNQTTFIGSYGRTSAETQADENQASTAKQPKKEKKVKEEDSDEDDY
jgi:hypothetical protein